MFDTLPVESVDTGIDDTISVERMLILHTNLHPRLELQLHLESSIGIIIIILTLVAVSAMGSYLPPPQDASVQSLAVVYFRRTFAK